MPKLGVNIDHIATLRQARRENFPDPVKAARVCELSGADSIVCHLRSDRRHINDDDLHRLRKSVRSRLNLEMSISPEILRAAVLVRPDQATIVPEKRRELTTEGGLDVFGQKLKVARVVKMLKQNDIVVNLFIDPEKRQIEASREIGADFVELHTGRYANAADAAARLEELRKIRAAVLFGKKIGLGINAGHGLDYQNVTRIAKISCIEELNIGFSIIAASLFIGLSEAVKEMKRIIN
ncbi:MAG: pyridoxine 5'-phosphate synthase [Candidatus Omnitrophica bacterium]|nr:pyridoxine 5'-phosphate synthase [Candidatus Omnitrophota bacterium]